MQTLRRSLWTLVIILFSTVSYAQVDFVKLDSIQESSLSAQANKMAKAFINADYKAFVKYTYPKAVLMLGGEAKMIETLEKGLQEMNNQGFYFKSVSIGEHLEVAKAGNEVHTFVAQKLQMDVPNGTLIANSYLLAITKDNGKTWHFIDSSPLTKANIKELLPNYNLSLNIPAKQKPIFTPAQ
jgi:hypothetical protein